MRALLLICLLFLSCLVSGTAAGTGNDRQQARAIMAAENFLLLIDTGQYAASWQQAAAIFRERVAREDWVEQISAIRPGLGKLRSRRIKSADHLTELPGAPDGEYYVIQYQSSFAGKENAIETVTPMLDGDGRWRVAGYYLK